MLKFIVIDNFALIDHLEVEFSAGLNLITGETGSGKSILVDAVSLLIGARAFQEMVRGGYDSARVEGIFELPSGWPGQTVLELSGIPANGNELIVRREISLSGTNRVFVNGRLTTLGTVSELGLHLADIHGQHDQQVLLQPARHLEFLDAFGRNDRALSEIDLLFGKLTDVRRQIASIRNSEQERLRRLDLLNFQVGEIDSLGLTAGVDAELEEERSLLSSAEKRGVAASQSFELLYEGDPSIVGLLDQAERRLADLGDLDSRMSGYGDRVRELRFQLEEVAYSLRDYSSHVEADPLRLQHVEDRLAEIQRLRRKYGDTVEAILKYRDEAAAEAATLSEADKQAEALEDEERSLCAEFSRQAQALSKKRRSDAEVLCRRMEHELEELAMAQTNFEVAFESSEELASEKGIDRIEFLISPNPGEAPKPLARIASGGELSRIMLSLKTALKVEETARTLVFDEVDAGIGGEVATRIGEKLWDLARHHQVFCVTHLPQIAVFGDRHLRVHKRASGGRTLVDVQPLGQSDRVEEVSRMLSGDRITDSVRQHARELLQPRPSS